MHDSNHDGVVRISIRLCIPYQKCNGTMNMYMAGGSTLVTKTMARQICWHVPGEKYYRELRLIIINVYNAERNGMEAESSGSSVQNAKL